ncbi:hypothetical protein HYU14_04675 [Candidatus Woesearchaeota archaeon]|nr:hypothetical protein [Candidatus Woesearchaeota archaeon]
MEKAPLKDFLYEWGLSDCKRDKGSIIPRNQITRTTIAGNQITGIKIIWNTFSIDAISGDTIRGNQISGDTISI